MAARRVLDGFQNQPAESTKRSPKTIQISILSVIVWLMCAVSSRAAVWYVNRSATGSGYRLGLEQCRSKAGSFPNLRLLTAVR